MKTNGRANGKRREIISFEPCGPVRAMLANELRRSARGAQTALMERAVVSLLGDKYPKLRERFQVLQEERAA